MKLVASMPVRDELARYQPRLTEHLLTYCDEVWVLDDCSRDSTGAALARLDRRVHVLHERCGSLWDVEGEACMRQALLDWTWRAEPDWVLSVDADELVPGGGLLPRLIRARADVDVFALTMREVWDRSDSPWLQRTDGGWRPHEAPVLWRADAAAACPTPEAKAARGWAIFPSEMGCGRTPEAVELIAGIGDARPTGLSILHLGWSDPAERRARYDRYMRLDGGRFHDRAHLASILAEPELEPCPVWAGRWLAEATR